MTNRGVNKIILVGNLNQDLEVRYVPNDGAIANIMLATPESWCDKATGGMKEQTEWHRVVLFGRLTEVTSEYLRRGSQVYIRSQLRTRKRTDQSGQDRYTTEVVVNVDGTIQMLGGRQDGGAPAGGNVSDGQPQGGWGQLQQPQSGNRFSGGAQSRPQQSAPATPSNEPPMNFDDDAPFWFIFKTIGYIVLRWMVKASTSHKKEAFVMEASTYQVKIIGYYDDV